MADGVPASRGSRREMPNDWRAITGRGLSLDHRRLRRAHDPKWIADASSILIWIKRRQAARTTAPRRGTTTRHGNQTRAREGVARDPRRASYFAADAPSIRGRRRGGFHRSTAPAPGALARSASIFGLSFGMLAFRSSSIRALNAANCWRRPLDLGAVLDGPIPFSKPLCWHDGSQFSHAFPTSVAAP